MLYAPALRPINTRGGCLRVCLCVSSLCLRQGGSSTALCKVVLSTLIAAYCVDVFFNYSIRMPAEWLTP